MAMSTVTFLTCDGPSRSYKPKEGETCGKVIDKPGKGVHLPAGAIRPVLLSSGEVSGEIVLLTGTYCWDCLFRGLDPVKQDPECSYSKDMRSLQDYTYRDRENG